MTKNNYLDKNNKTIFYVTLVVSLLISSVFLFRVLTNGLNVWGDEIKYDITGQVGDFIGGVVGTVLSGAGFYFLYMTLVAQRESIIEQKKAFERERFESKFFELINLHKENVNEMSYNKIKDTNDNPIEGRKVFNAINKEYVECLREVKRYSKIYGTKDFIRKEYKIFLENLINKNDLKKISIYDLAYIDIAYTIIYFGVTKDGEILVKNNFLRKYNDDFFYTLLRFIKLKPNLGYRDNTIAWNKFIALPIGELSIICDLLIKNKNNKLFQYKIEGYDIISNYQKIKFYGGHQHRLGHYYRHLFQTFKYLSLQKIFNTNEKYFFAKTLRAQLSNYEQTLLFVNSISEFGFSWELFPETDDKGKELKLITTYQLIKNMSGKRVLDVDCQTFYKKVNFEFEKKY